MRVMFSLDFLQEQHRMKKFQFSNNHYQRGAWKSTRTTHEWEFPSGLCFHLEQAYENYFVCK